MIHVQPYNYAKLTGRMRERGYTQESLAKALGISACSLNLTLNNKRNFRQDEILRASELLDIPPSDFTGYFFDHQLKKS